MVGEWMCIIMFVDVCDPIVFVEIIHPIQCMGWIIDHTVL